jgi:hypothetical protein
MAFYKFEAGKPYPVHNRARGVETVVAETNSAFFDVLYYIVKPSSEDIRVWRKSTLRYGLYEDGNIPFFLIDFPAEKWNFDVTINFLKVMQPEGEAWLEGKGNVVNLFLINALNNKLEAMRMISVTADTATQIRAFCEKQLDVYKTPEEADRGIVRIQTRTPTEEMIKKAKMIRL